MLPENPRENPAATVEALEKKLARQYPDLPEAAQQPVEPAEDADPGGRDIEASTVEPPD